MGRCSDVEGRIVSVTPCSDAGWRAVFRDETREGYVTEPVACWLLVDHAHEGMHIHPAVAMGSIVDDATDAENYLFVIDPDVNSQEVKRLVDAFISDQANK